MKPSTLIVVVAMVAIFSGVVTTYVMVPPADDGGRVDQLENRVAELSETLASSQSAQRELRDAVDRLSRALDERGSVGGPIAQSDIDRAVEMALAERDELSADGAALEAAGDLADAASGDDEPFTAENVFARLVDPDLTEGEWERIWAEARKAGLTDELVAMFEQLAEENPYDADIQLALGVAYLEKTQDVAGGPLAGVFAEKADETFDRALELDGQNWDARFTKAIALSFWPPVFGKQNEAIQQFEILRDQQLQGAPDDKFAQTYLLLGNLYQQTGQGDKALEAWMEGYDRYPDDEALADQLAALK